MANKISVILALVLTLFASGNALRILALFPHPGVSHFHFFHPIMRALAEKGHEVTVLSHFPDKSPPAHYKDLPFSGIDNLTNSVDLKMFENRRFYNHFLEFFLINEWGKIACEFALKSSAIETVLASGKKYDVIIMEQFNSDCMMGIAYLLKSPVIALSSCALMPWHYNRIGNPIISSYIPTLFLGQSEEMGFLDRVGNWITSHSMIFLYKYCSENPTTELLRKRFGNDMPHVSELVKETNMIFVNQHYSLSGAKPLSPAVIELGGLHIQKPKPLDVELKKILDSAENGAIYISWGSMIRADTLPAEKRDAIIKAVRRLKQVVLWKWENETLPSQTSNIHIRKWMPQKDILCHPNVKVFMTHGGLMGSSEAAYCGVPVVVTPMYGDQFLNAAALIQRGMGTLLEYENIAENTVLKALKNALEPKSLESATKVSYSFKNRPQKPLDTAIWWIEHVARTEGAPLTKSISTYLPRFVYHSLDVYAFLLAIFLVWIGSWIWIIKKLCCRKKRNQKEKRN